MADWPVNADNDTVVITTFSRAGLFTMGGSFLVPGVTTAWPAANQAIFQPFKVHQVFNAQKITMLNGATINGNFDVGIYDTEQNRLTSKGSTAHSGASALQTFDVTDVVLNPGVYYAAMCSSSTTATVYGLNVVTKAGAAGYGVLNQAVGAVTLPDPATFAAAGFAFVPLMMISGRTLI